MANHLLNIKREKLKGSVDKSLEYPTQPVPFSHKSNQKKTIMGSFTCIFWQEIYCQNVSVRRIEGISYLPPCPHPYSLIPSLHVKVLLYSY